MGRVQDKVVIVTGGAGGIGSAACRAIAAEGGKIVVADLDATAAESVAAEITADGGSRHLSASTLPTGPRCRRWCRPRSRRSAR